MMDYAHMNSARPKLTEVELVALLNLEGNKDFKILTDYFARRAIAVSVLSTEQVGEQCHWLQGRAQELKDMSNAIKNARSTFESLKKYGKEAGR